MSRPDRLIVLAVFLIACAFVFPNLGDRCLWQDEAETALIGANVLRTGLPVAWDGRQLVTQLNGQELTDSFLWAWTPWLMHYVAALGMAVSGKNSFGARWPFALLGCLSFPLFYGLVRGMTRNRWLPSLAVISLLASVQYLLLMRQCRYYALLPVLFFMGTWGYRLLPSKRGVVLISLGLVLLFHSNYVSCAMAVAGFLLHAVLFRRRDGLWKHLAASGLILGAGSVPWIVATGLLERTSSVGPTGGFSQGLLGTLIMSNRYVCPWLVLAGLGMARVMKRSNADGILGFCTCMMAPMFVFLPWLLWPNPRYVAFLLPVGMLIVAKAIRELVAWKTWLGLSFAAVVLGSNVLVIPLPALLPPEVGRERFGGELETGADALRLGLLKSEFGGYGYELTHSCRGPDEEIVSFVEAHTAPDDVIWVSDIWFPVMFHTGRRFAGVVTQEVRQRPGWSRLPPHLWDPARWLIIRRHHLFGFDPESRKGFLRELNDARVEKTYRLDVHDVGWINRPMLSRHVFRMPEGASNGIDVLYLTRSPGGQR